MKYEIRNDIQHISSSIYVEWKQRFVWALGLYSLISNAYKRGKIERKYRETLFNSLKIEFLNDILCNNKI